MPACSYAFLSPPEGGLDLVSIRQSVRVPSNRRLLSPPGRAGSLARGSYNPRKRPLRRSRCELFHTRKGRKEGNSQRVASQLPAETTRVPRRPDRHCFLFRLCYGSVVQSNCVLEVGHWALELQ